MIERIGHGRVQELRLDRPPANAFNASLVQGLLDHVRAAPGEGAEAIVISGTPGMFTGGLDVPELLSSGREEIRAFWRGFYALLRCVAASEIPVAAAITGHSPAAGAVLAVFCDRRVMAAGPFRFGMNEVQVGLSVPAALQYAVKRLTGARWAEALLVSGSLVSPEEALAAGLVDEVVPVEEVVPRAVAWAERLLDLPRKAMSETRRLARADLVAQFDTVDESTYANITEQWFGEETQTAMRALVSRLSKG